jgi:hypothetical protein
MRVDGATSVIVSGIGLALLSALAGIVSFTQHGLNSDVASWVQASGSIAAISGAVWLFKSEAALRRKERRAAGLEAAWAVRFALVNAQYEARTITAELLDEGLLKEERPERHWFLRTENSRNVLKVFSERTDHIHPAVNQIANNGVLLLRQLDQELGAASKFTDRRERPSIEVVSEIARYENHLFRLIDELDARMRGVLIALDKGNDSFPLQEFDFWQAPKK